MAPMMEIDGSYGEGGGQLLRSSLALSALTGSPVRISHIRAGRANPGLAPQHLTAALACAEVCAGRLEGAEPGSLQLLLEPGPVRGGRYLFDVARNQPSAGAVTLVLQAILPALLFADRPSEVILRGGTNVPWSPPYEYLERVFIPALARMGASVRIERPRMGSYPRGGGEVLAYIEPVERLLPVQWLSRGALLSLELISTVSAGLPEHIAERQMAAMRSRSTAGATERRLRPEGGPGTASLIAASFEAGLGGWSGLGERGKPAERVGAEALRGFEAFSASEATVDARLADQLIIYCALAPEQSAFRAPEVSGHLRANTWLINNFLPDCATLDGDGLVSAGGGACAIRRFKA